MGELCVSLTPPGQVFLEQSEPPGDPSRPPPFCTWGRGWGLAVEGPILHPVAPATRLSSLVLPPVLNTLCLKSALLLSSVLLLPWVGAPSLLSDSGLEVKWNCTGAVCAWK